MSNVSTNPQLIEEFLSRGVDHIYPSKEELKKKLESGKRLRVYQGFDPTGPHLHVGHAIGIRSMRILQRLGHEVIFLVGDFTSRVGDPDKDVVRQMLTTEQIAQNMKNWKQQAGKLIDFEGENPVQFWHNYDWLSKLKLEDIIELMSHMTVQRMLERDMFDRRYKEGGPIYLQEFIYPLMQGYDSVAMDIDIEICGADQTFNALVGRKLCNEYLGKERFVRTNVMMDAPNGRTMSKTKGNGINLADTPEDMYGKAMSYWDEHIVSGITLLTSVSIDRVTEIETELKNGANPMEFKKFMAYEIVKEICGQVDAKNAQEYFEKTVQKGELADNIPTISMNAQEKGLLEILVVLGFATSNSEGRRLVDGGAVKIDDNKVEDAYGVIALSKEPKLIKAGKRKLAYITT